MIQSFRVDIAPDDHGQVFLVMDTVSGGKHVFTAIGVGRIRKREVEITGTGQATLNALAAYSQDHEAGRFHMVEVATDTAAPVRVRKALEAADDKDSVFFVCRNPGVYDAVFVALNVDFTPEQTVQ